VSMRDAFISSLSSIAESDPNVILITGDLGFGVLDEFADRFPGQYVNAGVAEQNMTAVACGMAMEGCTVYTYSIGNFPTLRCLEHIRNDICYHNANVTIVSIGGGFSYGQLGMSHFATEDLGILRTLPNLQMVVPGDSAEVAQLLPSIHRLPGPKYLRLDKSNGGYPEGFSFELGVPTVVGDGKEVAFVATGGIVAEALDAARILKENYEIDCRVIGLNLIKPNPVEGLIGAIGDAKLIVTVEEHSVVNGLGTLVLEALAEMGLNRTVRKFGIQDMYPDLVGDQDYLRELCGLKGHQIAADVVDSVGTR
jgi:transketolase